MKFWRQLNALEIISMKPVRPMKYHVGKPHTSKLAGVEDFQTFYDGFAAFFKYKTKIGGIMKK